MHLDSGFFSSLLPVILIGVNQQAFGTLNAYLLLVLNGTAQSSFFTTPSRIPITKLPPPTTEPPSPATTGNAQLIDNFVDGAESSKPDEYEEIRKNETNFIQLQNWTLREIAKHLFTFPSIVIASNQAFQFYTIECDPKSCGQIKK